MKDLSSVPKRVATEYALTLVRRYLQQTDVSNVVGLGEGRMCV